MKRRCRLATKKMASFFAHSVFAPAKMTARMTHRDSNVSFGPIPKSKRTGHGCSSVRGGVPIPWRLPLLPRSGSNGQHPARV